MRRWIPFLLLFLMAAPALGASEWIAFASTEGRFEVLLPAAPTQKATTSSTLVGDVESRTFLARGQAASFTVSYTDLPAVGLAFKGTEGIFDEATRALLQAARGEVKEQRKLGGAGRKGRELLYASPGDAQSGPLTGHAMLYLVGRRLYVVDVVLRQDAQPQDAERFLQSFRVLGGN